MSNVNPFNYPLDNLPNKLIKLILSEYYSNPLNNLPNSLEYLSIGNNFSHHIDNLPTSLKYLKINYHSIQSLNYLTSLNHLGIIINANTNIILEKIPKSITNIKLITNTNNIKKILDI